MKIINGQQNLGFYDYKQGIQNKTSGENATRKLPFSTYELIDVEYAYAPDIFQVNRSGLSAENAIEQVFTIETDLVSKENIQQAKSILNDLLFAIKSELAKYPNASVGDKILTAYSVMNKQFGGFKVDERSNLFTSALINKALDCDAASLVIFALAEELKAIDPEWEKLGVVVIPGHVFIEYNGEYYDIIGNDGQGGKVDRAIYIQYFNVDQNNAAEILSPVRENKIPFLSNVIAGIQTFITNRDNSGNVQAAEAYFLRANEIAPNIRVLYQLGNIAGGAKRYADAISYYNQALQINPKYLDALYSRETAYFLSVDYISARRDFQTIKDLYPNDQGIQNLMNSHLAELDKAMERSSVSQPRFNLTLDSNSDTEFYYNEVVAEKYPELLTMELPRSLVPILNTVGVGNSNNIHIDGIVNLEYFLAEIEKALADFPGLENFYLREKQAFAEKRNTYAELIGGETELQRQIAEFYATHTIMRGAYNPNDARIIGKQKPPVNLKKPVIDKYPELADLQFPEDIASTVYRLIVENTAVAGNLTLVHWVSYEDTIIHRLEIVEKCLGHIQDFPSLINLYTNELTLFTEAQALYQSKKQSLK
jgi:tetratricopeptide (TPR) repeat protein